MVAGEKEFRRRMALEDSDIGAASETKAAGDVERVSKSISRYNNSLMCVCT